MGCLTYQFRITIGIVAVVIILCSCSQSALGQVAQLPLEFKNKHIWLKLGAGFENVPAGAVIVCEVELLKIFKETLNQ